MHILIRLGSVSNCKNWVHFSHFSSQSIMKARQCKVRFIYIAHFIPRAAQCALQRYIRNKGWSHENTESMKKSYLPSSPQTGLHTSIRQFHSFTFYLPLVSTLFLLTSWNRSCVLCGLWLVCVWCMNADVPNILPNKCVSMVRVEQYVYMLTQTYKNKN